MARFIVYDIVEFEIDEIEAPKLTIAEDIAAKRFPGRRLRLQSRVSVEAAQEVAQVIARNARLADHAKQEKKTMRA